MSDLTGQRVLDVTYAAIERRSDMLRRDAHDLCKLARMVRAFRHWQGMDELMADVERDLTEAIEEVRATRKISEASHAA